jgi:hypothetical protein
MLSPCPALGHYVLTCLMCGMLSACCCCAFVDLLHWPADILQMLCIRACVTSRFQALTSLQHADTDVH